MKRTLAHKFLTTITFLSVLAAMGCGTNSPVTPSQDNTMPGVENPLFVQLVTSAGSSRDMLGSAGSALITAAEGGIVSNGYYSLYFPPGALSEDTEITIEMPRYPQAVVELGPHGIQFNKPVTLSIPLDRIDSDASSFGVYWFNEDAGLWENIGGYTDDGATSVELDHFSDYGIGRGG
ncbi:MAG: hypothetical protein KOO63_03515 [Bacteroidales bacterium]|nr:hypothetical protein [Candidatus Latescibacterota bacterium]